MRKKSKIFKIIRLLIVFFFITNTYSAIPNNVTVTSLIDDGSSGTLRSAINAANSDVNINQIDFELGLTGTLVLTSDLPNITSNLVIVGPGILDLTISGNNLYKMFIINNGSVLTVSGITFTANASSNGSIFRADNNNSSIVANSINVTANKGSYAFYTNNNSTITISNSTFINNSSTLFGSDYGSTPSITSDTLTDYSNRITVTGSTFTANTGTIFATERYVKIDTCVFTDNTQQIGSFYGLNRYQVLNSIFTNNTGGTLFSFNSSLNTGTFLATLGTNQHLFNGNTFSGNTSTVINTGSANEQSKTTISNNIFINNGTSYTGTPALVINNTLDNFISSVSHSVVESILIVTMSRPVFNTNNGSGALEASDFELLLNGGNATLVSSTPSSISVNGNIYTLGIALSGEISGTEKITVKPVANSIYDASFNIAGISQQNNTINLNFLDDDFDGVSNFLDLCPKSLPGVRVYTYNGCEDTSYPFITYFNYGSTLINCNNFVSTTDHTLYFISYNSSWKSSIYKLSPEKVINTLFTPLNGNIQSLTTDTSDNLYFVYYDYNTNANEIRKISTDGTTSVLISVNDGSFQNLTTDISGNLYFSYYDNITRANEIRKISADGTTSVLMSVNDGGFQNLTTDISGNLYFVYYDYNTRANEIRKISADGTITVLMSVNDGGFQNLTTDNFGNTYFVIYKNSTNSRIIKKIEADATISDLYSTKDYIQNLKIDALGNLYFINYNQTNNSKEIKKVITTGIVLNLYVYGNNVYPQSTAIDAMNNLYFVTYDYSTGQQQINSITPEGIVISYGKFTGNELYNDRKGNIYFDDNMNHKIMGTKSLQLIPVLSDFNGINKNYFDGSFQIVAPSTDSMGTFTFESSNTAVATISGTTVSIVGPGITTIIATQSSDATHVTNSISANLTVSNVSVLTKNGQISVTDFNYVNKNGAVGTASGVNSNGESKITKTN